MTEILPMPVRRSELPDETIEPPKPDADPSIVSDGQPVTPFRECIIKVHSRCNLACTYCYMYEMADQTWRDQPRIMADRTLDATAGRLAEHMRDNGVEKAHAIFHGGEPLLAERQRPGFYRRAVGIFRSLQPEGSRILFGMQTNGTLLDAPTLGMLEALDVSVGVSIDGAQAANDRHRQYPNGKGSFDDVMRGITLLQNHPAIYAGVLCTVDQANDPLETYQALKDCKPPTIDFLLPLANWNTLPPHGNPYEQTTVYADWLIPIFDTWYDDPGAPRVRLFDEMARLLMGQRSMIEYLGLTPPANVVVETNGDIAGVDSLKSTREGMDSTGLNVFDNKLDEALRHGAVRERQLGTAVLSQECLKCELVDSCGGGYFPHRYSQAEDGTESFQNPSVFCADLKKLFGHITKRLQKDLAAHASG